MKQTPIPTSVVLVDDNDEPIDGEIIEIEPAVRQAITEKMKKAGSLDGHQATRQFFHDAIESYCSEIEGEAS